MDLTRIASLPVIMIWALAGCLLLAACGDDQAAPLLQGRWEVVEYQSAKPLPPSAPKLRFMTFGADGMLLMERVGPGGKKADISMEYEVIEKDGETLLHLPRMNTAGVKVSLRFTQGGAGLKIVFSGRNQDLVTLKRVQ